MEGTESEVVLNSLDPASGYTITVSAENRVGRSQPSTPIMHTTLEEPPTSYPTNIMVSACISDNF